MVKPDAVSRTMGAALRRARLDAHLTQEQLAERMGVSDRTVRKVESGDRWPSAATFDAWVRATSSHLLVLEVA